MICLGISIHDAHVTAIQMTLQLVEKQCNIKMDSKLKMLVQEGDDEVVLKGFISIFTYCSRLAHTLPSNPVDAGITMQYLELAGNASLTAIEETLRANTGIWLCDHFVDSTCADILLTARLRHIRSETLETFSNYPEICKYLEHDPVLRYV